MKKGKKKWKGKKTKKNFYQKHKKGIIISIMLVVIIIAVFGAKITLFLNFILGNDIVVKMDINKEWLTLQRDEQARVTMEASVTTNPFCKAICSFQFEDISSNTIIDTEESTLRPGLPLKKEYALQPPATGRGLQWYRFNLDCHSVRTVLCHTAGETTTRTALVTVEYDLTDEEKRIQEKLHQDLKSYLEKVVDLSHKGDIFNETLLQVNRVIELPSLPQEVQDFNAQADMLHQELISLKGPWEAQDYRLLSEKIDVLRDKFADIENTGQGINYNLLDTISRYNALLKNLMIIRNNLSTVSEGLFLDQEKAFSLTNLIQDFNSAVLFFEQKNLLQEKEMRVQDIYARTESFVSDYREEKRRDTLRNEIDVDIGYEALCRISGDCTLRPAMGERAEEQELNLQAACDGIEDLQRKNSEVNDSLREAFRKENYPDTDDFWNNIRTKVDNLQQEIMNQYRSEIPENKYNSDLLKQLLLSGAMIETKEYPQYNLTPALMSELIQQQPALCTITTISFPAAVSISATSLSAAEPAPVYFSIHFDEPPSQCCVFGACQQCCLTEECRNDPQTYPLVFLHGHAVSKETSFEYSLEGFNQIQEKLEEEGYVNAGAITLYTSQNIPEGIWGRFNTPVSIRGSYYFDIFQEPENYVVVQTKSENIDTYAVRLQEVIDTIKYKTGKPKVTLVAFSMGGLVSRRYVQIFGVEDVSKLIMIGTPNKGIVGDIADYCPLTGEKLECRDMKTDSLFMNKLNRGKLPAIPIYNIIGTGCAMDGKSGDGAVLEENARLEEAQNFIINGTCESKAYPLHLELRDIEKYPKVYEIIKKGLKE